MLEHHLPIRKPTIQLLVVVLYCGQAAGKKVILSIGGAAGVYGFTSVADAQK
jgi:hypothetical protein